MIILIILIKNHLIEQLLRMILIYLKKIKLKVISTKVYKINRKTFIVRAHVYYSCTVP